MMLGCCSRLSVSLSMANSEIKRQWTIGGEREGGGEVDGELAACSDSGVDTLL